MNILNYLLQTNLYLILFMGFYTLVLRNETFFRQNRLYLNTSVLLSFLIPFINSGWFREFFITQKVREAVPVRLIYDTITVGVNEETSTWSISDILFWIYIGGAAILFLRFLVRLVLLRSNLKVGKGSAFSFFNLLIVDKDLPESGIIIDHEKVHMREWHSADVLFIELAAIINWFNPVMYLYKKEIRHIHEFIADEEASSGMLSKSDYALLLFSNTLGVQPDHLSNNFFNNSLLKRRIIMLNKNKSQKTGLWKFGFAAPLFIAMLIFSAASASSENNILSIDAKKNLPILNIISNPETTGISLRENSNPLNKDDKSSNKESVSPDLAKKKSGDVQGLKTESERTIKNTNSPVYEDTIPSKRSKDITDFTKVEVLPQFHGGQEGWGDYVKTNLKYPEEAKKNRITGRVIMSFVVDKTGSLEDIKVLRGVEKSLDDEALRILKTSPKWKPGIQNGRPVKVAYTMPIFFQLAPKASEEKTN